MATYSNSPLVVYTKLSPNHSGQRTKPICRITPHCVVGELSVETLGDLFFPSTRQASCQYSIGTDGRRAMHVEEKNRSWCTSSNDNDQQAVTIECASGRTHPYAMNDKVYASLIELCVDICRRNGKKKLLWINDKNKALSYKPAADEMIITVHRWFANKSCCGDWLYERLGDLAQKVTAQLGGVSPVAVKAAPVVQKTNVIQGTPEKIIWNFLRDKGLNDFAIAGIMGNLHHESGLSSINLQNTFEKKLGMDDNKYTQSVDNGSYKNFVRDSAGYGLCQWTYWTRKEALLNYAKKVGKSIGDLTMQCEFLWTELSAASYKPLMNELKNAKSVREASDAFLTKFERPADQGTAVQVKRAEYGQSYYNKNAKNVTVVNTTTNKTTTTPAVLPYKVKVNDATVLRIRKGPGTNYAKVGKIEDNGIYTIVQESIGLGAKKWGKLKSGAGWISLDYCIKLS